MTRAPIQVQSLNEAGEVQIIRVAPSIMAWDEGYKEGECGSLKSENPYPVYAQKKRRAWNMGWDACKRNGLLNCRKTRA